MVKENSLKGIRFFLLIFEAHHGKIYDELILILMPVTPIAVTKTEVILLNNFRQIWTILEQFLTISNYAKLFWSLLTILSFFLPYKIVWTVLKIPFSF